MTTFSVEITPSLFGQQLDASLLATPQGAVADNATSDSAAFVSALASLGVSELLGFGYGRGVAPLSVPKGGSLYYLGTTPLEPNDTLRLVGQGTGMAGGWVSGLRWGAGSHGIRLQHYNTTGDTGTYVPTVTRGGQGSIISGLALEGGYSTTEGEFHGIFLRATASLRDLNIWNFEGDGIHIHADSQQPEAGNANCAEINSAWIQNTRDGVRIDGGDANQGYSLQLKVSGARRWGVYDERAWLHMGPLTQLCGFSGGDGTTVAKAVSAVANVAGTHRFAVIAGREVQASTNAPPVTAVDDSNYYYFEDGGAAAGLPTWFSGINLRAGGSYRLVNGGVILNGYHEGGQPPAQLGPGVLRIGGTWPTNSVRGGASILASANQVEINDLRVTAGGVSFDDDHTGVLMVGRYSAGNPGYIKVSSAATSLNLRAPDNSDAIEISNSLVQSDKDFNLNTGKVLKVAGTQVVGPQQTGWTEGTGTPNKGAFAAYAGATESVGYVQAEAQATNDAVKAASQRILALEAALRTHGLIN